MLLILKVQIIFNKQSTSTFVCGGGKGSGKIKPLLSAQADILIPIFLGSLAVQILHIKKKKDYMYTCISPLLLIAVQPNKNFLQNYTFFCK